MTPHQREADAMASFGEAIAEIRRRFEADRLPGESALDWLRRTAPHSGYLLAGQGESDGEKP